MRHTNGLSVCSAQRAAAGAREPVLTVAREPPQFHGIGSEDAGPHLHLRVTRRTRS